MLYGMRCVRYSFFFFFNDTATTEIYTLSLHDALPIFGHEFLLEIRQLLLQAITCIRLAAKPAAADGAAAERDRKITRLNSSHSQISYAVFCLKKKRQTSARFRTYVLFL